MKRLAFACGVALSALSAPALACTLCGSDTATAVRAQVLGSDFMANAAALAAPLPLLLAAVLLLGRDGRGRRDDAA